MANARGMKPVNMELFHNYVQAMDYDGDNNLIYIASADVSSGKGEAKWQIKKLTYDANNNLTDIQLEGGDDAFDAIWNDRTGLSYS